MSVLWRSLTRIMAALLLGFTGSGGARAQDPETAAWAQALQSNTSDAFQDYLSEYPMGQHSQDAFARLVELSELNEFSSSKGQTNQQGEPNGSY